MRENNLLVITSSVLHARV